MRNSILLLTLILFSCGESNHTYSPQNEEFYDTIVNGDLKFNESEDDSIVDPVVIKTQEEILKEDGWEATIIKNGQMSPCYNFTPKRSKIDNSLNVTVGGGTDVVIKLMNVENDKCIRYVFINSNTSYAIKNIPEGKYYLKIAYGKNWYSKKENAKCIGKFIDNPMYEKGEDIMDFNLVHSYNGYQIPSYELHLDVISSNIMNSFNSTNISEESFNN